MGLLDDAIREHLDLKRRRGADPTELAQAERDALGPVRRERDAAALEEADLPESDSVDSDPAFTEPASPLAVDPEINWDEPADYASDTAQAVPPVGASAPLTERTAAGAGEETVEYRLDDALVEEPSDPAADRPGAVSRLRSRFGRQSPAAVPDQKGPGEPPPDPNDVLEETPDFLQDTPDHDRLWFEQKPPRDFNFDG